MIPFADAVSAAAFLNNSVSAVDKIYNWWRDKEGRSPASVGLRKDDTEKVLKFVPLGDNDEQERVVMTYDQLAQRLSEDDFRFVKTFDSRMRIAMRQWEALNADLPLASPVERVRIEANMESLKDRDICASLKQIVDFIDKIGIDLYDHYRGVRRICSPDQN